MPTDKTFSFVKRNVGQLVTASELQNVGKYQRDTLLDVLAYLFRGYAGVQRSGVIQGFDVASASAQVVTVSPGIGLAAKIIGTNPLTLPVVVTLPFDVALTAPHVTNPRYDLIVLRPATADADLASRSVRLPDGTLTTSSLYGRTDASYEYHVYEGIDDGSLTPPSGALGEIPIAVVKVAPSIADVVYDVRGYLNPRVGGTSEYSASAIVNGAGTVTVPNQNVTDPTIQIVTDLGHALGTFWTGLAFPKVFGTHAAEYFSDTLRPHVAAGVGAASVIANPTAAVITPTSHPAALYVAWNVIGTCFTSTTGAPYTPSSDEIFLSAKFIRAD